MSQSETTLTTAEDWFARVRSGELTPADAERFRRWLAADPINLDQYERHELLWSMAGELAEDPDIQAISLDAMNASSPVSHRAGIKQRWVFSLAASLGLIAVLLTNLITTNTASQQAYFTAIGEQKRIELEDGSNILLNTNSLVEIQYSNTERRVELFKGEALFTVSKDPARPFRVIAGNGTATAVGTQFNVMLLQDKTSVSVLEGVVEVASNEPIVEATNTHSTPIRPRLKQGDKVDYSKDGIMTKVVPADIDRIESWQAGKLNFNAVRLEEVVKEHNRYSEVNITIRDRQLNDLLVSGVFNAGENDALLFALKNSFSIRSSRYGNVILLSANYE